jgi:hypothetical protein
METIGDYERESDARGVVMQDTNHALIRAKTREISKHINELKMYIDFKSLTFIKQGDGFSGIIVMFNEVIVLDEKVGANGVDS